MEYKVVTLYNRLNAFSVNVYQIKKSEFKVKVQIGHHSYSYDYVDNLYNLARSCFFFLINGYELLSNHLGFEFAASIHSGDFSEYEEYKPQEKKIEGKKIEITARQEDDENVDEPDEPPPPLPEN
jgi:hypothetical protein